jgi:hypothetical protein
MTLYDVLLGKEYPLSLAMTGDVRHPDWDYTFDDFYHGSED